MQKDQSVNEFDVAARKRRLKLIVIAHLVIVVSFFTAAFFWGNFA